MKMKKLFLSILLGVIWSSSSQALSMWVVENGQDPFSNSQNTLQIATAGTTTLDLYYEVVGDISSGYDINLDILGTGSITNVFGGDSGLGNSTATGWHQFGGPVAGVSGLSILAFTFDFTGAIGSSLSVSGTFTDVNFTDAAITASTLAVVSQVPVPAAFWLFGTAIMGISGLKHRNKFAKS